MSKLISCVQCGKQLSSSLQKCPHCKKYPYLLPCFLCEQSSKLSDGIFYPFRTGFKEHYDRNVRSLNQTSLSYSEFVQGIRDEHPSKIKGEISQSYFSPSHLEYTRSKFIRILKDSDWDETICLEAYFVHSECLKKLEQSTGSIVQQPLKIVCPVCQTKAESCFYIVKGQFWIARNKILEIITQYYTQHGENIRTCKNCGHQWRTPKTISTHIPCNDITQFLSIPYRQCAKCGYILETSKAVIHYNDSAYKRVWYSDSKGSWLSGGIIPQYGFAHPLFLHQECSNKQLEQKSQINKKRSDLVKMAYDMAIAKNVQAMHIEIPKNSDPLEIEPLFNKISSSKCFIATAAYGNTEHKDVCLLREYRDKVLLEKTLGRIFVSIYYHISPLFTPLIKRNQIIKLLVRSVLEKLTYYLRSKGDWDH